jgi:hypothetical protein
MVNYFIKLSNAETKVSNTVLSWQKNIRPVKKPLNSCQQNSAGYCRYDKPHRSSFQEKSLDKKPNSLK